MNFRRILSKNSLRSSSSSGKSLTQTEEVSKLHGEIELLKQTIDSLKVSVESRDAAIGTLAREKEKFYIELKSAQRTNRNLHQQLVDERDIHSKEKEFLINEIERISKQSDFKVNAYPTIDIENKLQCSFIDEIKAKDEIIYNIGTKYLKIKSSKMVLRKKLEYIQKQNKKTYEEIVQLLTENKRTLDILLGKLLKYSSVPPSGQKYMKLLQINAHLHYENTQLKIILTSQKDVTENPVGYSSQKQTTSIPSGMKFNERNNNAAHNVRHRRSNSKLYHKREGFSKTLLFSPFCPAYRTLSDSCLI